MKKPCVYIFASKRNGTLYTGMTSDIFRRSQQHIEGKDGFAAKYQCHLLVYIEWCESVEQAYLREKQIKGGSRKKKLTLIESLNPDWRDLLEELPYS